jgi:hypothetical protein
MPIEPDTDVLRIEELIRRRSSTDRRMGYAWMVVPLLPVIVGTAVAVSVIGIIATNIPSLGNLQQQQAKALPIVGEIIALYGLGILALYIVLLVGCFAIYNLIERRNGHFRRQQQLFSTLQVHLASKLNPSRNVNITLLAHSNEDSTFQERDRPSGLWAVLYLFVTPIVSIIVPYNLTQDLRRHEEVQLASQTALVSSFTDAGLPSLTIPQYRLHKRDPMLFVILSAITGGLFWVYWFYTLLKDYNEHFSDQARFEDEILGALKPKPPTTHCLACGGLVEANAKFCPYCGSKQAS